MINLRLFFCGFVFVLFFSSLTFAEDVAGSIGIQVVPISTGELSVLHVIDGSPAKLSGMLPGDIVINVDGMSMKGSDFDLVTRKYLWGQVGTAVSVVWLRPGVAGEMKSKLKRVSTVENMNVKSIPGVKINTPQ
jgi:C-terminal processing protease CtpA/Prc